MFISNRGPQSGGEGQKLVRFVTLLFSALILYIAFVFIGCSLIAPDYQTRTVSASAISSTGIQFKTSGDPGTNPRLFPNFPQVITPTCGIVTALTRPTGSTAGSITIEGSTYAIPPNTPVDANVAGCTNACAAVDPFGQILAVTYNAPGNIGGAVTAYSPGATITVNGTAYPIAASATIDAAVHVGDQVSVALNSAAAAACIHVISSGNIQVKSRIYLPSLFKQH